MGQKQKIVQNRNKQKQKSTKIQIYYPENVLFMETAIVIKTQDRKPPTSNYSVPLRSGEGG